MNGERRLAMRKAVFQLVLGVIVLDAAALGVYYFGGIERGTTQAKQIFTGVWVVATAITVAFLLRRVRLIRMGR